MSVRGENEAMDWQERMTKAIGYLEANLAGSVDLEKAAGEANCSPFHFFRMFDVIAGIGPGEYVRRRRLSLAAAELATGSARVIDVALKYGWESPDSFARAFRKEFGALPGSVREGGATLHAYPPLAFTIALRGDKAMEYRIEQGPEYRLTGVTLACRNDDGSNFREIPAFWEGVMKDGRFNLLLNRMGSNLRVCGVCHTCDPQGRFKYSIAIETPPSMNGMPEGCEDLVVPASTWAKFTSRGPLFPNYQDMIKRIYSEWFPASGKEHAGTAEIEFYPCEKDANDSEYFAEYWVPIK